MLSYGERKYVLLQYYAIFGMHSVSTKRTQHQNSELPNKYSKLVDRCTQNTPRFHSAKTNSMSSFPNTLPILDHIVILVSQTTLLQLPTQLKDAFIVAPGGEHADGLTLNRLILLQDGVYIELIAFHDHADPVRRKNHRWGQLPENTIIDWAYTLPHADNFGSVQQRVKDADAGYRYDDPVPGGRKRPDGEVLKWSVAAARKSDGQPSARGRLPFWCLDRTPRELRVPYENNPETEHPSGAKGVARVELYVPAEDIAALSETYSAIHQESSKTGIHEWHYKVPSTKDNENGRLYLQSDEKKKGIVVLFLGTKNSPGEVELVPGLFVQFTS